jgi:hypothetical protein
VSAFLKARGDAGKSSGSWFWISFLAAPADGLPAQRVASVPRPEVPFGTGILFNGLFLISKRFMKSGISCGHTIISLDLLSIPEYVMILSVRFFDEHGYKL